MLLKESLQQSTWRCVQDPAWEDPAAIGSGPLPHPVVRNTRDTPATPCSTSCLPPQVAIVMD